MSTASNCVRGVAWKATSMRIELRSFGYWQGSSGYAADRSLLTSAQLSALDQLCVLDSPPHGTGADAVSYVIRITDADGAVATYRAAQGDIKDGDEADPTLSTIKYSSLQPFLATFHCVNASQTRYPQPNDGADAGAAAAWSMAPEAEVGGCFHGAFVPYECAEVWLRLKVESPGNYRLSLARCFETTAITLLAADGSSELGSATGQGDDCPVFEQSIVAAGTYPLKIQKTNAGGCPGSGTAGDLVFQAVPVAP